MPATAGQTQVCARCNISATDGQLFCPSCGKPFPYSAQPSPQAATARNGVPATASYSTVSQATGTSSAGVLQAVPSGASRAHSSGPLTWGQLLLFSILSGGIFAIIQAFIQARWIRTIDPDSSALTRLILAFTLQLIYIPLYVVAIRNTDPRVVVAASVVGGILYICGLVLFIMFALSFRISILAFARHNGLPHNPSLILSVLFSVLYFQIFVRDIQLRLEAARAGGLSTI